MDLCRHSLGPFWYQLILTNHSLYINMMMCKGILLNNTPFHLFINTIITITTKFYFYQIFNFKIFLFLSSNIIAKYYNESCIGERYIGQQLGANPPHLFAIAEDSYANLRRHNRDQSILISGESGYVLYYQLKIP